MLRFELPTDWVEYLQLAFPATGLGLVARWGTRTIPFTVAAWDEPRRRPPPGSSRTSTCTCPRTGGGCPYSIR